MNDTFGAAFGRLIKRKRAKMKMTQAQLACALYPNLSSGEAEKRKGDISKLENGKVPNPTTQTIKRLADALGVTDDELDALHRRVQMSASDQLDNVSILDRDQLELLAGRFEIDRAFAKSDDELASILQNKAVEYRDLRGQIANLPEHVPQVMEVKQEAEKAAEALDFEKVEQLLTIADILDTAAAAQTKITRASNALLRNRPEQAFEILSAVADSFRSANPIAPAQLRGQLSELLYDHGLRYGGQGLQFAEKMLEEAAAALPADVPAEVSTVVLGNLALARGTIAPRLAGPDATEKLGQAAEAHRTLLERLAPDDPHWAGAQNNLGNALSDQGTRTAGKAGTNLLENAVTAYRAALTVYTEANHPVNWAGTQNNLGIALQDQGTRTEGAAGTALLAEAVTAYRNALTIRTEADHPVDWAMTRNNLGTALSDQGTRTAGAAGTALLADAVTANRAALTVYTEADHPVDWAMTQNNLGNALKDQGIRTEGAAGTTLLAEAVTAFRAALTICTEADHPVDWAGIQQNLAIAELSIAGHAATTDPRPYHEAALAHVDAALTVFDPEHMSYDHAQATRLRDLIQSRLEDLS